MTQDVTQGDLWQLINGRPHIGDQVLDVLIHFLLAIPPEVATAEILRIKATFRGHHACQAPFVEGHPHDDPDVVLLTGWKERVFWALLKNIVDHLNRIHQASFYQPQRVVWLKIVDRDPEKANLALRFEPLDGLEPVSLPHPLIIPDMELLKIKGLDPKIAQTLLGTCFDVGAWKGFFDWHSCRCRPLAILWGNLGSEDNPFVRVVAQDLSNQSFAVPLTIGQGGINKVHPQVDGPLQRLKRFLVSGTNPPRSANAPGPIPDLRNR